MRDYRDAKAMAQTLRQALKEKSVSLTHSESLELIAKVLGLADWNTLSARIDASPKAGPAVTLTVRKPVVPRLTGRIISANPMPRNLWMRLVSQIWMTKPTIDV